MRPCLKPAVCCATVFPNIECPPAVLQKDIDSILEVGVKLVCNHPVQDIAALEGENDARAGGPGCPPGFQIAHSRQ